MEDLEKTKENIQPLRGGRNVEQLEIALTSESQLAEERRAHEQRIENYAGDDPLQPWYEYICWIEQTDISNGKPSGCNEVLLRCIEKFENDERYHQDHRFIKLCMKYMDTQRSPQQLYQELYDRGIGTLCAELYIGWAYYYDAEDNFAQTESVFQKGLDAGATPREDIEQAHRQFGFSMSQRLLHKDESSKQTFKSSLVERRNALTSLKAYKKRFVGSVRTGLAVKSCNPGIVNQENIPNSSMNTNASLPVYSGAVDSSVTSHSIVRSLVNHARDRENIREPGPWSNAKSHHHKRGPLFGASHEPAFKISEDSVEFQTIPVLVDNLSRGIQLDPKHKRQNYPQTPFVIAVCDDDKPSGYPVYDKLALYCRGMKEDFSPEELRGYRYFKSRRIVNKMTEQYDPIWGNGAIAGIRLHPYHVREFKCQPGDDLKTERPTIGANTQGIQTRIAEMYSDGKEELSIEELRMQKWKDGKIKRHIDHKHDDDMMRVDMDETIVQSKRVSIAPPRISMMPMPPGPSRKSVLPPKVITIQEEEASESVATTKVEPIEENADEVKYTGAIKKSDIYKRRSVESPDIKPGPKKKISLEAQLPEEEALEQDQPDFVAPVAKPKSKLTIPIFVDDEEPAENKDTNNYYPNESCSTQMFNMFVKSQSTPLALKTGPTRKSDVAIRQPNLSFNENEIDPPVVDENLAQMHPVKINDENTEPESLMPLGSNTTHAPKQLSTIMERTENSTISGAGSTKSSVSSPPIGDTNSPMAGVTSDDERSGIKNMKQAVKNLTNMHLECSSKSKMGEDSVFKVPDALVIKPSDAPFSVFEEEQPIPVKPAAVSPFVIHIDSTETMANVPLVSKVDLPPVRDDKENIPAKEDELCGSKVAQNATLTVQEEATATGTANILFRNVSHLPQRDLGVNSIMSFKMTTERTNTVPLALVKAPIVSSSPPKADDSLFEVLAKTPSPKGPRQKSFFDLADFQKTPQPKNPEFKQPAAKQLPSTIAEAPFQAPKPIVIQSVMGAINLADFPSPPKRASIEDLNTEIFSLNMNNVKNSTLLPGSFPAEFDVAPEKLPTDISPVEAKTRREIDFEISRSEIEMRKLDLQDKKIDSEGFTVPTVPTFKSPIIIELDDGDSDELGKSIYVQKVQSPCAVEKIQRWDEIDEHFNPCDNVYVKKEVDQDETMQFIYRQTQVGEVDPFDPKLQEAFLENLDFMKYIDELTTCSLVNKVQPLSKGMVVDICGTEFSVQKKIGEGTFGIVYSAKNHSSNQLVAMKQERPANLWEYYICLELRSRVNNDDILPGMMSCDYAIVGNNASILVSPFSRFGNILDVCNVVKRVTNKNVDEFIAMIITSQILSIIDHLHSCMIIHADIKPDNFLLMAPIDLDARIPCVQLIDFGVSIDLKLFPKDTTFRKVVTTECFTCIEMLEKRPWTYQPDLYGVAGTTHVMLFGTYMEVQKDIVNWNIKARMPRYFRKPVWDNYFSSMLNIRDCNEMPNLQSLRSRLLTEIEENRKYIRDKVSEFNQAILSG